MGSITVDFNNAIGCVKPMHSTNNGPVKGVGFGWQKNGAYEAWSEAGIPYARTHDSSLCSSYGGEHTVDVHAVFPNFDADVNNPESYDFAVTDAYLNSIMSCGTKVFYRLGSKMYVNKYRNLKVVK